MIPFSSDKKKMMRQIESENILITGLVVLTIK